MSVWAVLLAAGSGTRLAEAGLGVKKQFLTYGSQPLFWRSARTFSRIAAVKGLVFVFPKEDLEAVRADVERLADGGLGLPYRVVAGGARRQDSVRNGVEALPNDCRHVLVHDTARPFVSARVIQDVVEALQAGHQAAIPAVPVTDTVKQVRGERVVGTLRRSELRAVQTPQGVEKDLLKTALAKAEAERLDVTDDASLVEAVGGEVVITPGAEDNVKITTPEDLRLLERKESNEAAVPVVGFGYDVHRYVTGNTPSGATGRPMKLGGVPIMGAPEVIAHSDGDVLLHALMDALLGCMGRGDIGAMFPDSDPAYEGMESGVLLSEVLLLLPEAGLRLAHVDLTVIAQVPRLAPHREFIRKSVAGLLGLDKSRVALKATTEEKLGFTGEKKGLKAVAVVTALRDF